MRRLGLVRNFLAIFLGNEIGRLRSCKHVKVRVLFLLVFIELLLWGFALSLLLLWLGLAGFFSWWLFVWYCTDACVWGTTYTCVGIGHGINITFCSFGMFIENQFEVQLLCQRLLGLRLSDVAFLHFDQAWPDCAPVCLSFVIAGFRTLRLICVNQVWGLSVGSQFTQLVCCFVALRIILLTI